MVKNLKKLIEQVAKEKNLPEWIVEGALKNAIALAVKKDRKLKEHLQVELLEEGIKVYIVKRNNSETVRFPLEISTEDVNRIAAYAAKEEFLKELEKAEEERGYLEFVEQEGEITVGIVRRVLENGDVLVDLGRVMGVLPKREQIPKESYRQGERIKALVLEVRKHRGRYEIILSRTHPKFLRKLLEAEVPEIKSGEIEIKAITREPGERAKVLVHAKDMKMDPVGVIVGLRGSRINPVSKELSGEKIDVIRWTENVEELIKKSLSPAPVTKVRLIPKDKRAEVAVPKEKLSLAIGKHGVNVKLANRITGWYIDVLSEEDFEKLSALR
ncbi:transcription termination factor NusA [Hydrogenobacter thermophilus TK-6]|uniref:Transcription termination/antitermination protein NusA n=1 Tax=Hydrogenobacter thermophilus (strain DSM 6534 / IAM 12695 / TK-6) TaxID=608538 RepID=D3DF87_HYDTT|nr:transcription termination factor NusA [Hydrogenobacter thermophilus]ADO44433.1 transcription termination factor NusA [Hydrogenobacter thermophilus TK-6]BAI68489.1 transcription elongation factor [Hydrogenobacter thermophilus TK-6]